MAPRVLVPAPATAPTATGATDAPVYSVRIAADPDEVRAAQRLRHRVFAAELGATLSTTETGLDIDPFDEYCDHLLIWDERTDTCVGTYRMLPPGRSPLLYSDGEFVLDRLDALRPALVETGRSCVDPAHRTGAVITLMWAGVARYLHLSGHRWLAGCASVSLADGGTTAAGVWALARAHHLAPPERRVEPRRPWPIDDSAAPATRSAVPPLLRGYLRLGARVCGPPAHDPDFGVADFFVLFSLDQADPRYLRHFLGAVPGPPASSAGEFVTVAAVAPATVGADGPDPSGARPHR